MFKKLQSCFLLIAVALPYLFIFSINTFYVPPSESSEEETETVENSEVKEKNKSDLFSLDDYLFDDQTLSITKKAVVVERLYEKCHCFYGQSRLYILYHCLKLDC